MTHNITILSGVVPYFHYKRFFKIQYKLFLQKYKNYKPRPFELSMYGGHYGVSRSMIEGLKGLKDVSVNYNPSKKNEIKETVVVISDINALRQAIELKKKGKIKKLIAGPNLGILPTDYKEISSEFIDVYITHADWCLDFFIDLETRLQDKMRIWPAGINEEYWKPKEKNKTGKKILFFKKQVNEKLYKNCKQIAQKHNFEVIELKKGNYTFLQYKELLQEVDFLVHFSAHESQGISLSESWSMNVPTMVWNTEEWEVNNNLKIKCSSAPYLNNENGRFFKNEKEFENLFKTNQFDSKLYYPRKYVLENLTDKKSAQILIDIINNI